MLRKEQNDLLTRTGARTPMGEMFRRYWMPALLAEELPENDCPPVRVQLLSERLIAFRDTEGRYGLMDEFCAHRGVSLWFGRNEECGLRCPYHGWKYDVTGQCVEIPSEPEESGFRAKIRLRAYPLVERGGVLWTYMGPPEHQPGLPEFEFATVPPEQTYTSKRLQYCNWLQAMEGGIDSSHVSWLHRDALRTDPLMQGSRGNQYNMGDAMPVFEVVDQPAGLFIGARRNAEDGWYWRITPWCMPSFTMIAPRGNHPVHGHFWIPIDDENCWAWSFDYHPTRALTDGRAQGDARRQGHPHSHHPRHVYTRGQPRQRLPDGPRGTEDGCALQRCRRHRDAGCVAAGEHGRRSWIARASICYRPTTASSWRGSVCCGRRARWRRANRRLAPIRRRIACARPPWCCRAMWRSSDAAREALTARPGVAPTSV